MTAVVQNFLYRNPDYYELIYSHANDQSARVCLNACSRYQPTPPRSILDIGCGTGRDLAILARSIPECYGVDSAPEMIDYARRLRPEVHFEIADMRVARVGRLFDVITSMGSAFMYAISNADVDQTLATFVAHAHTGTLLVMDMWNAASFLEGGAFQDTAEFNLVTDSLVATGSALYSFDRRRQLLVRQRVWRIEGQPQIEDFCEYRLFFPAELERLLSGAGFRVAGLFDNVELAETDLAGSRLYVVATKE